MNIFFTSVCPSQSAKNLCQRHVVKMILETAQLLCSVHHMTGGTAPYRLTHKNHPSAIWSRQNINNYRWLCELGVELCKEYSYRYGKTHKTQQHIEWLIENEPNLPDEPFFDPPQAMPDHCKDEDCVQAYRNYYIMEKSSFCVWKNREVPYWYSPSTIDTTELVGS